MMAPIWLEYTRIDCERRSFRYYAVCSDDYSYEIGVCPRNVEFLQTPWCLGESPKSSEYELRSDMDYATMTSGTGIRTRRSGEANYVRT